MTTTEALRDIKTHLASLDKLRRNLAKSMGCPSAYPSSGAGDGMPKQPATKPSAQAAIQLVNAVQSDIEALEVDLRYCARTLEPVIMAAPPCAERTLLICRYIRWLSMPETAKETGYTRGGAYIALARAEKNVLGLDKLDTHYDTL